MNSGGVGKRLTIAPYTLWMSVFVVVPIALVIYYAFTDGHGRLTLENMKSIADYGKTFFMSIKLALFSTAICLLAAYPVAYGISRFEARRQQTTIMLVMLPMWMNFLIRTYAWMTILEGNGLINRLVRAFGGEGFSIINTNGAVVLGMVYNFLPYMILPIYTVLTKIDKSTIEAAQDLGANKASVFRRVLLPMSVPGIISGITMVFVPAVSTFVISKLLGGGKTFLIGDIIENYFLGNTGSVDYNIGAALSLVLMALILISTTVMNHFDKDMGEGGGGIVG
jgi:spermidine/putrescine transport system permease protein